MEMIKKHSALVQAAVSSVLGALLTVVIGAGTAAFAQAPTLPPLPQGSSILLVNPDTVLRATLAGQATSAQIEAARSELIARASAISTAFEEEERALTELRATLPREEFALRVADFDRRVQAARAQQDADAETFSRNAEVLQRNFFSQLSSIYAALLRDSGAQAVLDIRSVLLADQSLDVTNHVIARLDAATVPSSLDAAGRAE
jgi:Skp family chaperone for outer membrane proteins